MVLVKQWRAGWEITLALPNYNQHAFPGNLPSKHLQRGVHVYVLTVNVSNSLLN